MTHVRGILGWVLERILGLSEVSLLRRDAWANDLADDVF